MEEMQTLGMLKPGQAGLVSRVTGEESIHRRLMDIGLVENTKVVCLGRKSKKGMSAYLIRGAVIALRRGDADCVYLKQCRRGCENGSCCGFLSWGEERDGGGAPDLCLCGRPSEKKGRTKQKENLDRKEEWVLAIAGNPNVGKSTVFNGLTGLKQHTGNWPGKTVVKAEGMLRTNGRRCRLVDLPGTYSLLSHSPEEEVTSGFLKSGEADGVLVVCDAACLERNLNLALQIKELGVPVFLCLNLMDEAERKGILIDQEKLSRLLSVPVAGVVARKKASLRELMKRLDAWLEELSHKEGRTDFNPTDFETADAHLTGILKQAELICREAVTFRKQGYLEHDLRLDRILTNKWIGYPLMLMLLALILWITICGANVPSKLLSDLFSRLEGGLWGLLVYVHVPSPIREAFVYGIFRVLAWVVAVMLPPMAIFFPLFTLLEDSGYLPRIAYNLDRPFQKCSACGKGALTMCMGLGCNAAGVTGCRIIDSKRERIIAILTNTFMPCNGRFPTMIVIISMFLLGGEGGAASSLLPALVLTGLVVLGAAVTFLWSKILSVTLFKGTPSSFTLELPPYRRPQVGKVLVRSLLDRTLFVLGRAVAVAAPAGLIIWLAANVTVQEESLLLFLAKLLDPFARQLGLDGVLLMAFILGFPANEIVLPIAAMAYMAQGSIQDLGNLQEFHAILAAHGWGIKTAVCAMLFSLMHWPCSTTLITIRKETGSAYLTALAFLLPTVTGMLVCFLTNRIMGGF